MINSRSLDDLLPAVKQMALDFISSSKSAGIDLLVTSTYRDLESQAALYAQGRTAPGRIVTNAKPGQSYHNFGVALDVVPIRNGKLVWDDKDSIWQDVGKLGEASGFEWAGRWTRFREYPHFQYTGGLTLSQLASGMKPT